MVGHHKMGSHPGMNIAFHGHRNSLGGLKLVIQRAFRGNRLIDRPDRGRNIGIMSNKIKYNVSLEKYLYEIKNIRYKMALSRFRLSNHSLLIETGRYSRPKIEREDRKCFICKDEIEDELHFVTKCPLYSEERKHLYKSLRNNSKFFDSLNKIHFHHDE